LVLFSFLNLCYQNDELDFPFSVKVGKLDNKQKNKTKFSDVAGMEEVKNELSEVVDYLKHPAKYHKV
jgi:cell division protease FtsH